MPSPGAVAQDVVDDRDDVGQALARAGAGRQDVVGARAGASIASPWCRCRRSGSPSGSSAGLAARKICRQRSVEQRPSATSSSIVPAGLERGVELDERVGPEQPVVELVVDVLARSARRGC